MKERPILFNGDMVRSILNGRKTQTRRVIKTQPIYDEDYVGDYRLPTKKGFVSINNINDCDGKQVCPMGQIGDQLYVRETLEVHSHGSITTSKYTADGTFTNADSWPWKRDKLPSIHMPKGLCRIWLEITDIRVERLNDISNDDARAEGIEPIEVVDNQGIIWKDYIRNDGKDYISEYCSFSSLWQSVYGEESWSDNPWVWVVEFRIANA